MERHQIDTLKARTSLAQFLETRGHRLKKNGTGLVTHCPFHEDDTPSLSVDPEKGLYHCFGCGRAGDILTFLQEVDGLSFSQALERLGELAGHEVQAAAVEPRPANGNAVASEPALRLDLLERVAQIYADDLAQNAEARQYLIGRGITDFEVLRALRVGCAEGRRLSRMTGACGESREALRALGLVNERGWDTLTGCVVVPLRDSDGRVTGFLGRRMRAGEHPHRTLSGARRGLFFPEAARGTPSVLLVEGFLDALACYQAGLRNVMALGGRVLTEEIVRHLVREGIEEVFLCLDADEAGDRGSREAAERLSKERIRARRVELPVKDPAEFFQGRTEAEFRNLLQAAVPLGSVREEALVLSED
ncbi:MAG: toprim domain-containing protein [Armatimonadetes bacterium]|nr:toprim domain-containing protein [Armatimonadota bacterium]